MNFFEHQDRARQNTKMLIGLFVMAVIGMVFTIYIAALIAFGLFAQESVSILWYFNLFVLVAVPTIVVIGCGSCFKLVTLRQGGKVIAKDLGGRLVAPGTADPAEQQLLNVVEEMAIAAGISVPAVYVLDQEAGINAFAAGFTPNDAVIGVTRGTLDLLNRDELQGVIGHEFSHILNGDMRLNLRLVGLLHGILLIYIIGRVLFRSSGGRSRSEEKGDPFLLFGLALILIGGIGLVYGRLIKSAVSRQREFLADASAVQFTRNPAGIAGALLKISGHSRGALIHSPYAEVNSHLFFGSAIKFNFFSELFATHPPLSQRIRKLQLVEGQYAASAPTVSSLINDSHNSVMGFAGDTPTGRSSRSPETPSTQPRSNFIHATPEQVIAQVGTVTPEQFAQTQAWLKQLPESIRTGLQNQQQATAIVYALMIHVGNSTVQQKQIDWLRQIESPEMVHDVLQFSQTVNTLDAQMRLPLLDLTIPMLRQYAPSECQKLFKSINLLAKTAGRWSLNDFVIYLVLFHRLKPNSPPANTTQSTKLEPIWTDCLLLLSALAQVGQTGQDAITYAFRSGLYRLPGISTLQIPDAPPPCNFSTLNQSLQRLSAASPKLKQAIVDACAHTVLLDQKVTIQEADLLRAIVITLDCPIPPFLRCCASTGKRTSNPKNGQTA
ncbi:transcriptional regulator [filamentous cyanobacterium CCP2]|nr:transcriptional regulator [filamentous cyanobacterium CCP2]